MTEPVMQVSLHGRQFGLSKDNELCVLNRSTNKMERIGGPSSLVGGAHAGATVARETRRLDFLHETITLTATPIALTDDAGQGQYGGVKIFDFPEGLILVGPCIVSGALTGYASLIDNFDSAVALGTATATTGNTLTGTEADIMQSNANATAASEIAVVDAISIATALTESALRTFDGTGGAKDMFLNFLVTDSGAHGSGTAAFTGTVKFAWCLLGDN